MPLTTPARPSCRDQFRSTLVTLDWCPSPLYRVVRPDRVTSPPPLRHLCLYLPLFRRHGRTSEDDAKVFHEMDAFLGGNGAAIRLVPVRLVMGDAPPSQLPIPTKRPDGEGTRRNRAALSCRGNRHVTAALFRSVDVLSSSAAACVTGDVGFWCSGSCWCSWSPRRLQSFSGGIYLHVFFYARFALNPFRRARGKNAALQPVSRIIRV